MKVLERSGQGIRRDAIVKQAYDSHPRLYWYFGRSGAGESRQRAILLTKIREDTANLLFSVFSGVNRSYRHDIRKEGVI